MSHWSRRLGPLGIGIATLLASSLAGCGVTSTGAQRAAPPSPTFGPTMTPRSTATPAPFGQECSALFAKENPVAATVGDMQFSAVRTMAIDPPHQLPDTLPLKPYSVNGGTFGYLDSFTLVNVHIYSFSLCNASTTKSHVISRITVKLDAFAADANRINTSNYCVHLYSRQGMEDHTGCGGGFAGGDINLKATFADNGSAGAVVPTTDANTNQTPGAVTLAPGRGAYVMIEITPPSTPGTAQYRIGFAVDGAALTIYPAPASPAVMNATATREWDGDACLSDAMQQQMPPSTNPPTYYICPQA
jgi:hypothetical protein